MSSKNLSLNKTQKPIAFLLQKSYIQKKINGIGDVGFGKFILEPGHCISGNQVITLQADPPFGGLGNKVIYRILLPNT